MEELRTSVALCTYNGARFLCEQLESIAAQSLFPAEVVVCDDGSTDETISIVQDFSRRVPFYVRIEINQQNVGSTRNFENAIRLCRGDIIALCDQDDVWHPDKLAVVSRTFKAHPEAGYVFSDAELIDVNGKLLHGTLWKCVGFSDLAIEQFTYGSQVAALLKKSIITGATMCFRATLVSSVVPVSEYFIHDYWISLVASCSGATGVPIPQTLVRYRQHQNQQIGARRKSIRERLARLHATDECEQATMGFDELWHRLQDLQIQRSSSQELISLLLSEKLEHCKRRMSARQQQPLLRTLPILSEVLTGRYVRFSNSWRSVVADLCF